MCALFRKFSDDPNMPIAANGHCIGPWLRASSLSRGGHDNGSSPAAQLHQWENGTARHYEKSEVLHRNSLVWSDDTPLVSPARNNASPLNCCFNCSAVTNINMAPTTVEVMDSDTIRWRLQTGPKSEENERRRFINGGQFETCRLKAACFICTFWT